MKLANNVEILYEDASIIVCVKPAGVSSQAERGFDPDMVSILSNYFVSSNQASSPYVGVIHRLDKPVCGVMVYAKTKNAASVLSKELARDCFSKKYFAIVTTPCPIETMPQYIRMEDYLLHDVKSNSSSVVTQDTPNAKKATLEYKVAASSCADHVFLSLLDIHLLTGRHHQIRVQLSHAGMPILGDKKYGIDTNDFPLKLKRTGLMLCAYNLSFKHPDTGEDMNFSYKPDGKVWNIIH